LCPENCETSAGYFRHSLVTWISDDIEQFLNTIAADRSDIDEELVRLQTHATQLEAILKSGGEVGKRLDFLLQEMNRESNTILSKTGGLGDIGLTITELALAAKSEIDKIREQSLNLE